MQPRLSITFCKEFAMPLSTFKPDDYQSLLEKKTAYLQQHLAEFNAPVLSVFASPTSGFRMRAEFRFWHEEHDSHYVMFAKGEPDKPIFIDDFPIAHAQINRCMKALHVEIMQSQALRQRLFQVEFLSGLSGDMLVTLIYHRKLDEEWQLAAKAVEEKLNIGIIGRSRKQKVVLSRDHINELLEVDGKTYHYQQVEGSFTQPNAVINQCMLTWAKKHSVGNKGDLLELYCGNGNFTAVLAENFNKVLATEISKTSVKSAHENFAKNTIDNIKVCRMSSEDFTSALQGVREFNRLKQQEIVLSDYQFSTVLVDPPRAGLDEATVELIQQFDNIIYISCNPVTLACNLQTLCQTHQITAAALFDQFPYTDHIETGLILKRR